MILGSNRKSQGVYNSHRNNSISSGLQEQNSVSSSTS